MVNKFDLVSILFPVSVEYGTRAPKDGHAEALLHVYLLCNALCRENKGWFNIISIIKPHCKLMASFASECISLMLT